MSATSKHGMFAVCGSFIALSTISIGLRFYARKYQKVSLGWDDWTALFGVITFIPAASIAIHFGVLGINGYGNITPAQMAASAKTVAQLSFAYDYLNLNTLACAKVSALLMYRRIFTVDRHSWFNRIIIATLVVIALWYITSDFLSLYQCPGHFSAAWDGRFKEYCYLNPVWAQELAISDFILDVWVLLLPIVPIMKLHTTFTKKLSIFGVFLLAFVGLGASIARIYYFVDAHGANRQVLYIAMLESGMSITVVNLPSIYYLCTSVIPNRVASSLHSIRSLGSHTSQDRPSRSNSAVRINDDEPDKDKITSLEVHRKSSSWSSQETSGVHGNHTDVEAGEANAYEMRNLHDSNHNQSVGRFPQTRIHVKNDVEVRME